MDNKEAIWRIRDHMIVHSLNEERAIKITEALEMAIKAMEKEPCEDAVSAKAVEDMLFALPIYGESYISLPEFMYEFKKLPHVTPTPKVDTSKETITVPVNKIHVLTKDEIKDIDPWDDVFVNVAEKLTQTISLVKEDQDKFIFEAMVPFLTEINHIIIPKRVLERALFTFEEEHTAEWKALMKEYGGTGI